MPSKPNRPGSELRRKGVRDKVDAHRRRMRAKGYRLVQFWLPDTRTEAFAARARTESMALARHPDEPDDQAFVDSVSWLATDAAVAPDDSTAGWWRVPESEP